MAAKICPKYILLSFTELKKTLQKVVLVLIIFFAARPLDTFGQRNIIEQGAGRLGNIGGAFSGGNSGDSVIHRDRHEDSITISFKYLNDGVSHFLDSSITELGNYFPLKPSLIYLGNIGNAARPILFTPTLSAGFDAGFHVLDAYKQDPANARFFTTTRPHTELNYSLASEAEQVIEIVHTQNPKPNFNFSFQYQLINSPGIFRNQFTNHGSHLITSSYTSKNKRYHAQLLINGNRLKNSENGGITDAQELNNPTNISRFDLPVFLGKKAKTTGAAFRSSIDIGNIYNEATYFLRQQYDFGRKDSIVTDSTITLLFYPKVRFEHNISYNFNRYTFIDIDPDSTYYQSTINHAIAPNDTVFFKDVWKIVTNDFSIYQFPSEKNQLQYLKAGLSFQTLRLENSAAPKNYFNLFGHFEYRNPTKNKKWDIISYSELYFAGLHAGNYLLSASVYRKLGEKTGDIQLSFKNINRSPSQVFENSSSFYRHTPTNLNKENITLLSGIYTNNKYNLSITGNYYNIANLTVVEKYYQITQSPFFNLLQISATKKLRIYKNYYFKPELSFQQTIGNTPVNVPAAYARARVCYEGSGGHKNLDLATGFEFRYITPYRGQGYSPALGQFYHQDSVTIKNSRPDISFYIQMRIKSMKLFFQATNLNAATLTSQGLEFKNNNTMAPGYYYPGMVLRLSVYWNFVN